MVAAGDCDLFNPGRVRAGYQYVAGRLLRRSSRMAVAVLAGRGYRAADGTDGLSRYAARTGQPGLAQGRRLGRNAAARYRRFDDVRRPRSGQSSRLAGIRAGGGGGEWGRRGVWRL